MSDLGRVDASCLQAGGQDLAQHLSPPLSNDNTVTRSRSEVACPSALGLRVVTENLLGERLIAP